MKKPSVSELIGLLDKPRLLPWANKIGLEGISLNSYRQEKLANGSSNHKMVENFIKHKTPYLNKFTQIRAEMFFEGIEVLGVEEKIETDYFTGRYDLKIKKNGIIYMCDFKSNHRKHYDENILQLAAYKMASNSDKVAIISLPDFDWMPLEINDFSIYEDILKNLSNIYNLKQQLK